MITIIITLLRRIITKTPRNMQENFLFSSVSENRERKGKSVEKAN